MGNKSLYRGVSEVHFNRAKGGIIPKLSTPFASYMQCGQEWAQAGSGMCAGLSAANEVVKHQFKQLGLQTSGISTTPHFHRAKYYATCGGKFKSGYVYKFDRSLFLKYCIREYVVSDIIPFPSVPEDDEIIMVSQKHFAVPDNIILSITLL